MRCPKCHYLSFDPEPRCKNCGYDLEVADSELALRTAEEFEGDAPDLPLRPAPQTAPPVTLELVHSDREPELPAPPPASTPVPVVAPVPMVARASAAAPAFLPVPQPATAPEVVRAPTVVPAATVVPAPTNAPPLILVQEPPSSLQRPPDLRPSAPSRSPHTTTDLPLFVKAMPPREEIPQARPPLAVRRPAPEVPRAAPAPKRRPGPLDHDLLEDLRRVEREEAAQARVDAQAILQAVAIQESEDAATSTQRLGAAALDGLVLGGIGSGVLWATLRLCGVALRDLPVMSVVPLVLFLGGVAMSYLLLFTAAEGQTPGKMFMGIRVVSDGDDAVSQRLGLGQAASRALLALVSLLPLGLGWIPALFGRGLAVHDRLAHTRVIRA